MKISEILFEDAKKDILHLNIAQKIFDVFETNFDFFFDVVFFSDYLIIYKFDPDKQYLVDELKRQVNLAIDEKFFDFELDVYFINDDGYKHHPNLKNASGIHSNGNIKLIVDIYDNNVSDTIGNETNIASMKFLTMKDTFVHEYVHFIDDKIKTPDRDITKNTLKMLSKGDYVKYYNEPIEFNAHFIEALKSILFKMASMIKLRNDVFKSYNPHGFIEHAFKNSSKLKNLYSYYNNKNKRKMLKRLYGIYQYLWENIKDIPDEYDKDDYIKANIKKLIGDIK